MPVIPFEPEHLNMMELRQTEIDWLQSDVRNAARLENIARVSHAGTLVYDGIYLAAFGSYEQCPGRFMLWAYPSVHVKRYAMIYLRTVRRYIRALEQTHNPVRLQTEAMADDLHTRWMEFLGFTNETPNGMKNYLPWGTFNMWAKTYGA